MDQVVVGAVYLSANQVGAPLVGSPIRAHRPLFVRLSSANVLFFAPEIHTSSGLLCIWSSWRSRWIFFRGRSARIHTPARQHRTVWNRCPSAHLEEVCRHHPEPTQHIRSPGSPSPLDQNCPWDRWQHAYYGPFEEYTYYTESQCTAMVTRHM